MKPQYQFVGGDAQELYDIAPCGYISTTSEGAIVAINQTLLDWTGFDRSEIVSSRHFQDLLTTPGKIFYETHYAPMLHLQGVVKAVTFDIVCKDSALLPVLVNATRRESPVYGAPLIHCAIFDATDRRKYEQELLRTRRELEEEAGHRTSELEREVAERQRAEESLRQLTARLLQIRDDEQRRLARALHDSVGQLLAAISMNQAALAREKDHLSERGQSALTENIEMTNQILTEVRTISQLLHPPLLDEVGLNSALRWYIEGINKRSAMKIDLELSEDFGRLPAEMETAAFRITQECLTNAHRHASSARVTVKLSRTADAVSLRIVDEGIGMSESKIDQIKMGKTSGVGLRGMRERIRQLKGTLDISSSDKGTIIQVQLPIP
jgi:PAS domain S-box-containing protein